MGQVINGIRGIFSYHRTTLRMMTSSVTMTCFLAISVCNAKQTFMLYERKVGQERKRKEKTSTRETLAIIRDLLKREGIRRQNKCSTSVLKIYIGIIEDHTHFLLDAIYIYIWEGGGTPCSQNRWRGIVAKVCN